VGALGPSAEDEDASNQRHACPVHTDLSIPSDLYIYSMATVKKIQVNPTVKKFFYIYIEETRWRIC
jgi:CxxC motif-containing protein